MFELINVSKKFGHTQVLDSITLSLSPGSRTAIVGPSGSGKTTLLRLIAGFEMPDSGQITMRGTPLFDSIGSGTSAKNWFCPAGRGAFSASDG